MKKENMFTDDEIKYLVGKGYGHSMVGNGDNSRMAKFYLGKDVNINIYKFENDYKIETKNNKSTKTTFIYNFDDLKAQNFELYK